MRTGIWVGLGLLAGLALLTLTPRGQGRADDPAPREGPRRITTVGTGTVAVTPDTARISFAVGGSGKTMATAGEACDTKVEKVTTALNALRLEGVTIKRGPLHLIGPGQVSQPGGLQGPPPGPPAGPMTPPKLAPTVEVSRTFTVLLTADKTDKLVRVADRILQAAIDSGANEMPTFNAPGTPNYFGGPGGGFQSNSRIELYRADVSKLRAAALRLAVADAVANARAVAGSVHGTIKDIIAVTDQPAGPSFGLGLGGLAAQRGEVLGESEITVTVSVTCSY